MLSSIMVSMQNLQHDKKKKHICVFLGGGEDALFVIVCVLVQFCIRAIKVRCAMCVYACMRVHVRACVTVCVCDCAIHAHAHVCYT